MYFADMAQIGVGCGCAWELPHTARVAKKKKKTISHPESEKAVGETSVIKYSPVEK